MDGARSIYVRLLVAAIVIYVIGVTVMQADMYVKIVRIERALQHCLSVK